MTLKSLKNQTIKVKSKMRTKIKTQSITRTRCQKLLKLIRVQKQKSPQNYLTPRDLQAQTILCTLTNQETGAITLINLILWIDTTTRRWQEYRKLSLLRSMLSKEISRDVDKRRSSTCLMNSMNTWKSMTQKSGRAR